MLKNTLTVRPFNVLPALFDMIEQEHPLRKSFGQLGSLKTNIVEQENAYIVSTEVPGLSKENISVTFEDDILKISTQVSDTKETTDGDKVIHQERYLSNQSRSFRFDNIDAENISAKYDNGILTLTLNKKVKENTKNINIE